ncbi:hypothetical protein Droror1_Dr00015419 [Drosera rotundifolia]
MNSSKQEHGIVLNFVNNYRLCQYSTFSQRQRSETRWCAAVSMVIISQVQYKIRHLFVMLFTDVFYFGWWLKWLLEFHLYASSISRNATTGFLVNDNNRVLYKMSKGECLLCSCAPSPQ